MADMEKKYDDLIIINLYYLDSKESGVNEPSRDSLSHNLRFLHRLWCRAAHAPRPAAINSCAGTRHARRRHPVTAPCGTTWGSLHTPSSPGTWLYHNIYWDSKVLAHILALVNLIAFWLI